MRLHSSTGSPKSTVWGFEGSAHLKKEVSVPEISEDFVSYFVQNRITVNIFGSIKSC